MDGERWKMIPVKADPQLRRDVRREAQRRGVSVSELVREAVRTLAPQVTADGEE